MTSNQTPVGSIFRANSLTVFAGGADRSTQSGHGARHRVPQYDRTVRLCLQRHRLAEIARRPANPMMCRLSPDVKGINRCVIRDHLVWLIISGFWIEPATTTLLWRSEQSRMFCRRPNGVDLIALTRSPTTFVHKFRSRLRRMNCASSASIWADGVRPAVENTEVAGHGRSTSRDQVVKPASAKETLSSR